QMGRTGVGKVLKVSVGAAVQEDRSRHFGALASLPASAIEREIDRLVEAGYLDRDDSEYRRLSVSRAGYEKPPAPWPPPRPIATIAAPSQRARSTSPTLPDLPGYDEEDPLVEERFAALKEWRREQLRGTNLPAYTVLNDETLRLLAGRRVTSIEDLARVKGIGPAKLARYGESLLALLREEDAG
ncbi:MAG: HRDC domain-containing protein, partial [Dehalococcoidia bacterium]